jgi:hypothetical protein
MTETLQGIRERMSVFDLEGVRVGKVARLGASRFELEKGFLFPKLQEVSYELVRAVTADQVFLSWTKKQLDDAWHRTNLLGEWAEVDAPDALGYTVGIVPPVGQDRHRRATEAAEATARNAHSGPASDASVKVGAPVEDEDPIVSDDDPPRLIEGRREVDDYLY